MLGYVYLLPREARLNAYQMVKTGTDGSYSLQLPQGSYTVYAFEHRFSGDLRDTETVASLSGGVPVQVTVGVKASTDVEAQPVSVMK